MYNVLVFPAGEMNAAEIHTALSHQVNIRLFGAASVERLGHHLFARYRNGLPNISDPGFIDDFNALIDEWQIDIVIPTHDSVVTYLTARRQDLHAVLLAPDMQTAEACRDKRLTYELLASETFTPKTYSHAVQLGNVPVFVKPVRGQGSIGARRLTAQEATSAVIDWENEVVCEYLPGEEVTVDCFTDRHGNLLGSFPRTRERTLGGISVAGVALEEQPELAAIASVINARLAFLGMWYFQAKRDLSGRWKLLEISARGAGAQCLTRARGVNLPLLSVYTAMGIEVSVDSGGYGIRMDRVLANRYDAGFVYHTVYIDFDDTITCQTVSSGIGVNPDMMRLLYQFRNDGKTVKLVTRHADDLDATMQRLAIPASLFDEIIHLLNGEPKADVIDPSGAIFIDNAFAERRAVRLRHGIPVLDVDTTEILHHWRR